jgi:hypothetical protein
MFLQTAMAATAPVRAAYQQQQQLQNYPAALSGVCRYDQQQLHSAELLAAVAMWLLLAQHQPCRCFSTENLLSCEPHEPVLLPAASTSSPVSLLCVGFMWVGVYLYYRFGLAVLGHGHRACG